MTGVEWATCDDVPRMLGFLRGRLSNRRLRLFACAACRMAWNSIPNGPAREAVVVAERFADGLATPAELAGAARAAEGHRGHGSGPGALAGFCAALPLAWRAARHGADLARWALLGRRTAADIDGSLCELLRCLAGDPSRPARFEHPWRARNDRAALKLAQVIYEGRELPSGRLDSVQLAILADALEEAGCDDQTVLDHLRGPGPHVRGCFAVDACLGRV